MKVEQISALMNDVTEEVLGSREVFKEDLSNVIDGGEQVFNSGAVDNYVKSLVNHIGRVVFVNRPYEGSVPSVLRDSWEYGSVLEKITAALPTATENPTWDLQDGKSYDPNVFTKPNTSAKFYNDRTTFEIPMSFTERQVKESFSNAEQLNAFVSMIETAIYKSLTIKNDALVMRLVNDFVGETLYDAAPGGDYSTLNTPRAMNLRAMYNAAHPDDQLATFEAAISNPRFIRFASYKMKLFIERMKRVSTLFNVGETDKFTPESMLNIVLLNDFAVAADIYEQSDTFHDSFTALPNATRVPYWQGTGEGYGIADISKIDITTHGGHDVQATGVLGVMFDRDALGVCNFDQRVTTNYNPRGEFYNNWYKQDAGYWVDTNEQGIVFLA